MNFFETFFLGNMKIILLDNMKLNIFKLINLI